MNILILNWRDTRHPLAGGAEISLLEHAKYWQKKGATVMWFAQDFKNAKKEEVIDGIKIIRRGNHFTVHIHFFISYILHFKSYNFNVIVDCFHFLPFFTPLFIRNKPIVALINEVAGEVWFENLFFPLSLIGFKLEPYIIRLYKRVTFITGSNSAKKDLIRVGIKENMIKVINHGFTKLKFAKKNLHKEKSPTLIFLARVSKDKGIEDALVAVSIIKNSHPAIKLLVVGKFESEKYREKVKEIVLRLKIQKNVTFYGYVTEEKKAELLSRSWLLVHPSVKEGWGLNVIEANSLGVPAIGYNVQGLSDSIVSGKTGVLINSDPISLADEAEKLLISKSKIDMLSKEAIEWSKNFSWEKSGEKSWEIIKNLL